MFPPWHNHGTYLHLEKKFTTLLKSLRGLTFCVNALFGKILIITTWFIYIFWFLVLGCVFFIFFLPKGNEVISFPDRNLHFSYDTKMFHVKCVIGPSHRVEISLNLHKVTQWRWETNSEDLLTSLKYLLISSFLNFKSHEDRYSILMYLPIDKIFTLQWSKKHRR